MTTLRQIEANRRNATLSTGPKTPEGLEMAKRNALQHNLSGEGVVRTPEEADAIAARLVEWRDGYWPTDAYDEWLLEQAVFHSVRIERCRFHDWALRMLAI